MFAEAEKQNEEIKRLKRENERRERERGRRNELLKQKWLKLACSKSKGKAI